MRRPITKCLKISPIDYLKSCRAKLKFVDVIAPQEANIYFTSEENAYGATMQLWYNGEVVPYTLQKDIMHYINVKTKEFHHLENLCQPQSFYQCLASKFSRTTTCSSDICSPFTLPTDTRFEDVRICNETEFSCRFEVYWSLLFDNTTCKGDTAKACVVKEYTPEDSGPQEKAEDGIDFSFAMSMQVPKSSNNYVVIKPYKTIFTEHYVLSSLQLVGTIGGTLGLMIGFSFMGSITTFAEFVIGLKAKYDNGEWNG